MEVQIGALPFAETGNEVSSLRRETGKTFELDPKMSLGQDYPNRTKKGE